MVAARHIEWLQTAVPDAALPRNKIDKERLEEAVSDAGGLDASESFFPCNGKIAHEEFRAEMSKKTRNILRICHSNGHDQLIIGARSEEKDAAHGASILAYQQASTRARGPFSRNRHTRE